MSKLLLRWRHAVQRSNVFLHSLGNTSRHFRVVERPSSGRGSVDQSEATEHWRFPGLFRVMRFISSRNTNGSENQVARAKPAVNKRADSNSVPRAARTSLSKAFTAHSDSRSYLVHLDFDWPKIYRFEFN